MWLGLWKIRLKSVAMIVTPDMHDTPRAGRSTASAPCRVAIEPEVLADYMRSREVYRHDSLVILVDAFRHIDAYMMSCRERLMNSSGTRCDVKLPRVLFFLSHFHSDHYNGITKNWRHGTIYASRGTANLLCWRLGVQESYVKRMDLCTTYVFSLSDGGLLYEDAEGKDDKRCSEGLFSVTLVPANHCPGAVMFLLRSSVFGTILHTGDFRFSREKSTDLIQPNLPRISRFCLDINMAEYPVLRSVAGQVDVLFLDNTFCDARFDIPPSAESLHAVNQAIVSMFRELTSFLQSEDVTVLGEKCESKVRTVCVAVLIGTYFIGKERIALSIQDVFVPDGVKDSEITVIPTYVSPEKYESLRQVECYPERFVPFSSSDGASGRDKSTLGGFGKHAVRLPEATRLISPVVARNLSSSYSEEITVLSCNETKYCLTPFLVPLSCISYRALAAACGERFKRQRNDTTTEDFSSGTQKDVLAQKELLSLWGDEVIDLREFDGVLCVEPTGWTKKVRSQRVNERVVLLSVPYSEHCSFSELVDFVQFINPTRIVPTVSMELFKKYETSFAERAPRLRQLYSNVQPLCRFMVPKALSALKSVGSRASEGLCTHNSSGMQKQRNPFASTITHTEAVLIDDSHEDGVTSCFPSLINVGLKREEHPEDECKSRIVAKHDRFGSATQTGTLNDNIEIQLKSEKKKIKNALQQPVVRNQMRTQLSLCHRHLKKPSDRDGDDDDCDLMEVSPSPIVISDSSN